MTTLWKRATPAQRLVYRIIAGSVRNAMHSHSIPIDPSFARSVAKRATGTLTAHLLGREQLATASPVRQTEAEPPSMKGSATVAVLTAVRPYLAKGNSKDPRAIVRSRGSLRRLWSLYSSKMARLKVEDPARYAVYIDVLRDLDREIKKCV